MTAPIETTGSEAEAQPEAVLAGVERKAIQGRSLGQIAWLRLKRDKVAMAGGILVVLLIVMAIVGPFLVGDPNEPHNNLIDPTLSRPKTGIMHSGISADHWFGVDLPAGRDMFSRIVNGAKYSLLISFLATMLAVVLGVFFGVIAGYFGGWVDTLIARAMDIFLAFPLLLFAIALVGVFPNSAFGLEGNGLRVAFLIFVIGFFSWPYIGRIIRGQTLSLREREFVDAARSMGARAPYILFRELLPNLWAPILVYATLMIPTNIIFEASLSFLGVGIIPPTPSWGGMLNEAKEVYEVAPHFMFFPGMAIFITVLAFNLFGDGLRDALDPRSSR
ncbi:ABC transporter permease [Spirillospora sp. NPDC048911]|uniref:ABC transporter permease n=1 Tax=Spirillospora sp. NPDC048911 TaxID=3364527 RepID=UPI00371942BC